MLSTNTIIFLNYFRSAVDFFVINPKALAIKSQLYLSLQHCKIGAWMSEKEEMKKAQTPGANWARVLERKNLAHHQGLLHPQ